MEVLFTYSDALMENVERTSKNVSSLGGIPESSESDIEKDRGAE